MSWIKSQIAKALFRHLLSVAGTAIVAHGYVTNTGWEEVLGAGKVIGSFAYSLWEKRALIKADFNKAIAEVKQ